MKTVSVKTVNEQAAAIVVKHHEMLVGQRTQAINILRGHEAEFGCVAAKGCGNFSVLLAILTNDPAIPALAHRLFTQMGQYIEDIDTKIEAVNEKLVEKHKTNPVSQRLEAIPGLGPIAVIALVLSVNPTNFESDRHFAARLGLTPREHSAGGKQRLGGISKAGNERLLQLPLVGAMSVVRWAKP